MIPRIGSVNQITKKNPPKYLEICLVSCLFLLLSVSVNGQIQAPQEVHHQPAFTVEVYGSGTPVYLIPGLASGGEVWYDTVDRLKDRYECHVFTLAGFAGKEPIEQKPYLATIKKELEGYMQKQGEGMIIGHSLGGFLALWMTAESHSLARKAIIVDSYPFLAALRQPGATEETVQFPREAMIQQMARMDSSSYRQQQKNTLSTMISDEQNIKTALQWSMQSDRPTIVHAMGDLMETDLRDALKTIKTPTLIMIAGNISMNGQRLYSSEQVRQTAEHQYRNHPTTTIEVADNAKHFIMMDDPQWFYETLEAYLDAE